MNTITRHFLICGAIAVLGLFGGAVGWAQDGAQPNTPPAAPAAGDATNNDGQAANDAAVTNDGRVGGDAPNAPTDGPRSANDTSDADPPIVWTRDRARGWRGARFRDDNEIVTIGGDATLAPGARTDNVASVFGSSTSAGEVRDSVVSVLGDTRIEGGSVGDSAVSVLGSTYVNGEVDGDVVAILGDLEFGPNAKVRGDAVVIGGQLIRHPDAVLSGSVQNIMKVPPDAVAGFKSWLKNCVRYLRPLAFAPGLGWAWTIALTVLALYALFAVVFRRPLDQCVRTLEERPGETIVASVLAMLLSPVLYVVLGITIIGIAFMPIVGFGMLLATLFGKAVVLAWIGRGVLRVANQNEGTHSAIAVLIGGAIILLLYVVPVLGFIVFNLIGILGFGAVVYTLMLAARERRQATPPPSAGAGSHGPGGPAPAGPGATGSSAGSAPTGSAPTGSASAGSAAAGSAQAGYAPSGSTANLDGTPAGAAPFTAGFSNEAMAGGPDDEPATAAGFGAGGGAAGPPPTNGTADALSLPRAGFWIRMLALLIDAILVGVVFNALDHHARLQLIALAAYGAIMWKLKGTTVGGIVCNLKIVRLDGRPVDWSTAIVRALGCFLSLIVCGLGFIWIAFDPGRQAWHDKIAGTAVVRVPQGVSLL